VVKKGLPQGRRYCGSRGPGYTIQQQQKPGIVGWAQVNDRCGETGEAQQIELDLHYI
jgi:lipopolysaccharide/colanic/teichoic acid biosynthesis glycosyltransferase